MDFIKELENNGKQKILMMLYNKYCDKAIKKRVEFTNVILTKNDFIDSKNYLKRIELQAQIILIDEIITDIKGAMKDND